MTPWAEVPSHRVGHAGLGCHSQEEGFGQCAVLSAVVGTGEEL